jgi:hypothetical protein
VSSEGCTCRPDRRPPNVLTATVGQEPILQARVVSPTDDTGSCHPPVPARPDARPVAETCSRAELEKKCPAMRGRR